MKNQVNISVVIPTLNEEQQLPKLLTSLQQQTRLPHEVIHVDGNSQDQTVIIATSFATQLPLTTLTTETRNVCYQRNMGAQKARGEWLLFLDADVTLPSSFMDALYKRLAATPTTCFNFQAKYAGNSVLYQVLLKTYNSLVWLLQNTGNPPVGEGCFAVEAAAFHAVGGFTETLPHSEGRELVVKIKRQKLGKLKYLATPHYFYNVRRLKKMGARKLVHTYLAMWLADLLPSTIKKRLKNISYSMQGGTE